MYWFIAGLVAIWVLVNGYQRKNAAWGWAIGTFLVLPIFLPLYLAKRNLKEGEVREGGTGWNFLRYFAIVWTVLMLYNGITGVLLVSGEGANITDEAEAIGFVFGVTLGLGMLAALWFFVTLGALVLGLILKKSSVVERGPTGALAGSAESTGAAVQS